MQSPPIILEKPPTTSLFIAFFCVLFSVIFNYTLSIMASPYIVGELGGSNDIATYTVTFFALGNALGVPLGRTLLNRIGTARFLVSAMLLFTLFSWTCAIAPTYPFFNASRFLQGFVSGPFYALGFHLFSSLQPTEKKGLFTSISLSIFTVGPVIGACWGGWIAYEWDWRWCFYFNIPFLLFLAAFLHRRLKGFDAQVIRPTSFDGVGYLVYFIGIFSLGFAVITGQELDWFRSSLIIVLFSIGIPSLLFFIFWEFNHPNPILYLNLLKNPVLLFALFNLAVLFSAYFGMIILLSLWLKLWANYTPDWIAALLGTMAITGLFPMFLIDRRIARIDNRIFLALSIIFLAISCFHTMIFNVEIDLERIVFSRLLAGLGLALFLAPIFRLAFHSLPEEKNLHVLGLFQVTRALASGLGAAVYAVMWQRRQVFFHERLGSRLTPGSEQTQTYFAGAENLGLEGETATAQLDYFVQREATSLALDDCFYLMAWILLGVLLTFIFTFFAKPRSFVTQETNAAP
ncbi:MAG: DHA2 family efflux MFS transporter permease subunit [Verrucomicrobia bacterium]|nr:DHA2 family efflux MFS transporter permease subunit [Verrucomicrobiota bacterium]